MSALTIIVKGLRLNSDQTTDLNYNLIFFGSSQQELHGGRALP